MNFNEWLDTFIEEKGLDMEATFEVEGSSGTNIMPYTVVVEGMKATTSNEQRAIKDMIVKIDFFNGDVLDYFRHLGQAIAV